MARKNSAQPYFPLECNNRNKTRILKLRIDHGVAGYGIYIMLMERLRCADGFAEDYDIEALAFDFRTDCETIESVICDYGLFEVIDEGTRFHSPELTGSMAFMEEQRQKRAEAARKAALARWGKRPEDEQPSETPKTDAERIPADAPAAEPLAKKASGLEAEVAAMKDDKTWKEAVCERHKVDKGEVDGLMDEFKDMCKCEGKQTHRDMQDAKSHFNRWLAKRNASKQSDAELIPADAKGFSVKGKADKAAIEAKRREQEIAERNARYEKMKEERQKPEDYIRKLGYDPSKTTLAQVMNHKWREEHPPMAAVGM